MVSSDNDNKLHSTKLVDQLLLNNGYTERVIEEIKEKRKRRKKHTKKSVSGQQDTAMLKLPYLNEVTSRKYRDAIKHSGLPIKLVEKPGRRLKDLLTNPRVRPTTVERAKHSSKEIVHKETRSTTSLVDWTIVSRPTEEKLIDL